MEWQRRSGRVLLWGRRPWPRLSPREVLVPLPVALSCAILDIPATDRQQVLQWGLMFRDQLCKFGQSREAVLELEHKATVLNLCPTR